MSTTAVRRLVPIADEHGQDARFLLGGIGRSKVYDLIGRGLIETVKLDGRTFITMESIDRYIDSLTGGDA